MTGIDNIQNLHGDSRDGQTRSGDYACLAAELAAFDGLVVAVMNDSRFAGQEVPAGLRFRHFHAAWSGPGIRVVALDADQIRAHAIVFKGGIDILVYPYGGVYPMEAFKYYSGQSFQYFLRRGGAVLTTGGIPLSKQSDSTGKSLDISTPEALLNIFDRWIARFGIKYYQCLIVPAGEQADANLLPERDQRAIIATSS